MPCQTRKRLHGVHLLMIMAVLLWSGMASGASKQILEAAEVKAGPTGLDDAIWNEAKAIQVPFEGKEAFAGQKPNGTVLQTALLLRAYSHRGWS